MSNIKKPFLMGGTAAGAALLISTFFSILAVDAACSNPSPIPTGFAAPCPVFSLSAASVTQSQTLTLSATPQVGTDYIYTTAYVSEGTTWNPYTLAGNNAYPAYSSALASLTLSSTQLSALSLGTHYAVVWDWLWDATAQCYKGPGLNQCNTGEWRVQSFNLTSTYAYSQSSYYAYSQASYYAYSQSSYTSYTYSQSSYYAYSQSSYYAYSQAAYTSGTLIDSSRRIDWSNAGATIQNRTTLCATTQCTALNTPANVTAANINSAIASAAANTVVLLPAGTFNLSGMIDFANHSNVTLRGAGANQTFLVFSSHGSCHGLSADICVGNADTNYSGGPSNTANWTGGYSRGATSITLSSLSNLAVGNTLVLDQLNDASDPGTDWICATQNVCANDVPGGAGRSNRDQQQLVKVTGISSNTVTITPGLYMPNWRSGQNPGAWWATTNVKNDGVENVSINNTGNGGAQGIVMFNALNCWVKGIRSITPNRNHVWIYVSAHITVRDSYFYGTQNYASQSYGVETFGSSDNLIENNIFQKVTSPLMANGSLSGTVRSYNFTINDFYDPVSPSWLQPGEYFHTAGTDNVLEEGNITSGLEADQVHGTHNFITAFRNQLLGWEAAQAGAKTQQTIPVHLYTNSRYFNIVGNVLGKSGYHNHYEDITPSGTNGETSIYTLGWSGNGGGTDGCCTNDPKVASTLMRWGNYDVVSNTVRFMSSEVPSGLSQYANPVPSNQTLPASLYLSARPSWWPTSKPWPPIGPDVTGGNIAGVAGHVYSIPAQDCYSSVMAGPVDGSGGVLNFNPAICYP